MSIRRCRFSLLSSLLFVGALTAQSSVAFSFEGAWTASGRTREGVATSPQSYVSLSVGGYPEVVVLIDRGDSPAVLADKSKAALESAGFVVVRVSPTVIRVTGRVGGSAISGRGAIGENDDNLKGTDLEVVRANVAFGSQPGPTPTEFGYGMARPTGNHVSAGGTIQTTLEFEGATQPLVITVNVPPFATAQLIDQLMFQGFVQNGVMPRSWLAPSLMQPNQRVPMFGLDYDMLGRRISHVACEPLIEIELLAMELQSCMPITAGVTEFGWSWPTASPMHLGSDSVPRIGAPLTLELTTGLPGTFAGMVVGLGGWSLPLPELLNGTPAPLHDGPTLFVQPIGGPITGICDAAGRLQHTMLIPPRPALVGLPLHWQGFDLGAPAPTVFWLSNGVITRVGV